MITTMTIESCPLLKKINKDKNVSFTKFKKNI